MLSEVLETTLFPGPALPESGANLSLAALLSQTLLTVRCPFPTTGSTKSLPHWMVLKQRVFMLGGLDVNALKIWLFASPNNSSKCKNLNLKSIMYKCIGMCLHLCWSVGTNPCISFKSAVYNSYIIQKFILKI